MLESGILVVLEGMDGSGKTTLAKMATQRLQRLPTHMPVESFSPKSCETSNEYGRSVLGRIAGLLWPSDEMKKKASDFPVDYWFHLQAAWYAAMSELVLEEKLAKKRMLISDGWYYKFAAKLCVQGRDAAEIKRAFAGCREPDLVIHLDIRAADVWDRKKQFSAYEIHGLTADRNQDERQSFIEFQGAIQSLLREWADMQTWAVLPIQPEHTEEQVVEMIVDTLGQRGLLTSAKTLASQHTDVA